MLLKWFTLAVAFVALAEQLKAVELDDNTLRRIKALKAAKETQQGKRKKLSRGKFPSQLIKA